ncbi:MAG: DUF488 domain-containing protein [Cyanobacteria bacterium]|nr:DUF488 domain-containing protein [Cyanobacteriota bacterium]
MSVQNSVFTFGYGNRKDYGELLFFLKTFNISAVIDVRLVPRGWSARWSARALETLCQSVGIQYLSKTALGNESGKRDWIPPDQEQAEQALQEVAAVARQGSVLLLCAELDWQRCHRTEVAERLRQNFGFPVQHLTRSPAAPPGISPP